LDLFQTLAAYAAVDLPQNQEFEYPGQNFLDLLDNSAAVPDWRREQYGEYGPLRMIRTERYKLLLRYPNSDHELFDLLADPREMVNLFQEPQYEALIQRLAGKIERYFGRYEDPVKRGLNAQQLPRHNSTEAWRSE
jgi:arylsulfatase A-like enzyme